MRQCHLCPVGVGMKKRVFICSPYSGERERNNAYLSACISDSLDRGEAPFAPHFIYPQFLNDDDPCQRAKGIACGMAWLEASYILAVYSDLGISAGMLAEIDACTTRGIIVEHRSAGAPWKET